MKDPGNEVGLVLAYAFESHITSFPGSHFFPSPSRPPHARVAREGKKRVPGNEVESWIYVEK